jgi:hypothetical protein
LILSEKINEIAQPERDAMRKLKITQIRLDCTLMLRHGN